MNVENGRIIFSAGGRRFWERVAIGAIKGGSSPQDAVARADYVTEAWQKRVEEGRKEEVVDVTNVTNLSSAKQALR